MAPVLSIDEALTAKAYSSRENMRTAGITGSRWATRREAERLFRASEDAAFVLKEEESKRSSFDFISAFKTNCSTAARWSSGGVAGSPYVLGRVLLSG